MNNRVKRIVILGGGTAGTAQLSPRVTGGEPDAFERGFVTIAELAPLVEKRRADA
jgi:hypothetical protein